MTSPPDDAAPGAIPPPRTAPLTGTAFPPDDGTPSRARVACVTCVFHFEAAHHLPQHAGRCRNLHGHGYKLEVTVEGPVGDGGMVLDFAELETAVRRAVVDGWDHRLLNEMVENPTAENLAWEAYDLLRAAHLPVRRVRLWETPDAFVEVES